MKIRIVLFSFLISTTLWFVVPAFSQTKPLTTKSKKAERYFMDAVEFYQEKDFDRAIKALNKATEDDPYFIEAFILQGDILADKQQFPEAVASYKHALSIDHEFSPQLYYISANLELSAGLYLDSKKDYLKFLQFQNITSEKQAKARNNINACDFGINAMDHPVPFDPVNLGDSINSRDDEYVNGISSDDQKLYFTRKLPRSNEVVKNSSEYNEDFYCATRVDSIWRKARNLGPPINTYGNEGAQCISPDGQFLFFAACERDDGYGSCDLYWARKEGDAWSVPVNMGPVINSPQWDSQPSFSSDGVTLYFASKRKAGKGSSDIWRAELQSDGSWSEPVNLGDSINTSAAEMAPFIHPDDQTLYFSSRGHPGMGGLDLYYSRKDANSIWKKPFDLGYPINTFADEITLVVNAAGDLAYFSSDKLGGLGKQDIYSFKLYPEARPGKATYMKGIVFDNETKKRIEARFELIDLALNKTAVKATSDPVNGEFLLSLPTDRNYALNVSKEGYLFYSDHFELKGQSSKTKPFIKNIPLQPIRVGETVILKNVFFDTDKFDLKKESRAELGKLISFLNSNKDLHIELSGHTDNQGTPDHNITLSQNRAKAVFDYLVEHGVGSSRLTYIGYGLTKPIDTNETEQGRANNRRTEFRILSK
jgi:outer membrane protein OmpA-like peptidoglycan-associated protein